VDTMPQTLVEEADRTLHGRHGLVELVVAVLDQSPVRNIDCPIQDGPQCHLDRIQSACCARRQRNDLDTNHQYLSICLSVYV
jgi:hypothetical protein